MVNPNPPDFILDKMEDGHVFTAGRSDLGIRKNESVKMFVDVPPGSDRFSVAASLEMSSTGSIRTTHKLNVSVDSQGTLLENRPLRTDAPDQSIISVYNGGEYSGGESYPENVSKRGVSQSEQINVILPPGDNMLVEATVRNPGGADISKKVTWIPINEVAVNEITDIDTGDKL